MVSKRARSFGDPIAFAGISRALIDEESRIGNYFSFQKLFGLFDKSTESAQHTTRAEHPEGAPCCPRAAGSRRPKSADRVTGGSFYYLGCIFSSRPARGPKKIFSNLFR
jgi:hypothetical protein